MQSELIEHEVTPARIWTLSNGMSLFRVVLIVPVAFFIIRRQGNDNIWAFMLVVAAGFTDLFDGMLARALDEVTEFGKVVDPLADKLCVAVIGVILTVQGRLPLWFIGFALVRDVVVFTGGLYVKKKKGIILVSNLAGKWATVFIAFLVGGIVLDMVQLALAVNILLALSMIMLVISSAMYAKRFSAVMKSTSAS